MVNSLYLGIKIGTRDHLSNKKEHHIIHLANIEHRIIKIMLIQVINLVIREHLDIIPVSHKRMFLLIDSREETRIEFFGVKLE